MRTLPLTLLSASLLLSLTSHAENPSSAHNQHVSDNVLLKQDKLLYANMYGNGFGPQSPRDIDSTAGTNAVAFNTAPPYQSMNLCNIHLHKNAEHKGGEFTKFAGNGDGHGYHTGYQFSGDLTEQELSPIALKVKSDSHKALIPGDTLEVHFVHSTAQVKPGPTLGACLSEEIKNPQLRVEAQVIVLVNDKNARDFRNLTKFNNRSGFYQAVNIPSNTGKPVQYAGSTTGPSYNIKGSPFQVTWSVRPKVLKVDISTVNAWLKDNTFNEDHAHGVRNLVTRPEFLSPISH
ncbi:delta-class carbonic anhydrase [Neptuniibacter sp. QD34_54]|uniref:delta-class carbonic anhydrase n=1 Tax=Neptuniibacter sp. QD34_54 TaxID=3398208 RepID=UPI0039F5B760